MRHVLKTELLHALKASLQDVESLKLISENDPKVAVIRNDLRKMIIEIEHEAASENKSDIAA